jgi:hypothetical protein
VPQRVRIHHNLPAFGHQLVSIDLFHCRPGDACRIVSGARFAADMSRPEVNYNIVILNTALFVIRDWFKHAGDPANGNFDAAFFAYLARRCVCKPLAEFKHPAGQTPLSYAWRPAALDQKHTS